MAKTHRSRSTPFWIPIYSEDSDEPDVCDYSEVAGDTYLTMKKGKVLNKLPHGFYLVVAPRSSELPDFVANPLGIPIVSDRLREHLVPMINDCIQLLRAPLVDCDMNPIDRRYWIVNVTRVVDCLDVSRSVFSGSGETVIDMCIDPERAGEANMFKVLLPSGRVHFDIICNHRVPLSLKGKGFTGMAFLKCKCRK